MSLVLIVDDEADLTSLVEFNLQQAGFETIVATCGHDALNCLMRRPIDLLVVDLMLPDVSGVDICKRIRAEPQFRQLPIVMLTARSEETDRLKGFEVGADDYITKPFSPRELVMRVKAVLRRTGASEPTVQLQVGLLKIDSGAHRAWAGDTQLELTALEFKLLHYFMVEPGRVRSRERLLSEVWNMNSPLETRTVDTHVMRLREKLGIARQQLETVRGVGYRLTQSVPGESS